MGTRSLVVLILIQGLLLGLHTVQAMDLENCLGCHALEGLAVQDSAGTLRDFRIDPDMWEQSVHGGLRCRQCHTTIESVPHPAADPVDCTIRCHMIDPRTGVDFSHQSAGDALAQSVHGQSSRNRTGTRAPGCKDCHLDSHYWQGTPPNLREAERKCLSCHQDYVSIDREMRHLSLHLSENQYWRHKLNFDVCIRCHNERELLADSTAADRSIEIVSGFLKSFHGTGFQLGNQRSPVCADCHSHHLVLSHTDMRSPIHPDNLQATCSSTDCHTGSQAAAVSSGSMHRLYQGWRLSLLGLITGGYAAILAVAALLCIILNLMETRALRRHERQTGAPNDTRLYRRTSPGERLGHVLLMISFSLLALSGAALWLPEKLFTRLGEPTQFLDGRTWWHRAAALLLMATVGWRALAAIGTVRGRALLRERMPRVQDLDLLRHHWSWMRGRQAQPAAFAMYRPQEKLLFWSFVWGFVVMAVTGILLWFHGHGRLFVVDVARTIHSLEALLGVTVILLWHLWDHLAKPGRWLWSDEWLSGRSTRRRMHVEHGGMLAELDAGRAPQGLQPGDFLDEGGWHWVLRQRLDRSRAARVAGTMVLAVAAATAITMVWGLSRTLLPTTSPTPTPTEHLLESVKGMDPADPWRSLATAPSIPDWQHARFHHAGPAPVPPPGQRRSECLLCHDPLPHGSSKEQRAYLNMHGRFLTCEACHGSGVEDNGSFAWIDLRQQPTGATGPGIAGMLITTLDQEGRPVFHDLAGARALALRAKGRVDRPTRTALQETYHDGVASLAQLRLTCEDCHDENGRIDFGALGFDSLRTARLRSATKAASVAAYEAFHLPPTE